jgi:hypothetical protein
MRHKWFVFLACLKLGVPLRLAIFHDISKFRPSEWFPYVNFFHVKKSSIRDKTGYYKPYDTGDKEFDFAWLLHQKANKHHWQWWILPMDEEGIQVLEMPNVYIREMICDWIGAGMAQGTPDILAWYKVNKHKLQLHPDTRWEVERILAWTALDKYR